MAVAKLRRKRASVSKKRKRGNIHNYKFAMCAKKCRGDTSCMSSCLKGR